MAVDPGMQLIHDAAKRNGFAGGNLIIAIAVGYAESGGDPKAHNPNPPDDSYGLMQINMIGELGNRRRLLYKLSSNEALYEPNTNLRVAHAIWQSDGWDAWSTYTNGAWKQFKSDAEAIAEQSGSLGGGVGAAADAVADAVIPGYEEISALLAFISDKKNWFRLAMFLGGTLMIFIAAALYGFDKISGTIVNQIGKSLKKGATE